MSCLIVYPSPSLRGTLQVPGDKSISHRAILLGSIAEGLTRVENLLEGEDVLCTIRAMRALGIKVEKTGNGKWKIEGAGKRGLRTSSKILDCGNSGTTLRLLTGLLAGQTVTATLTGDPSLNSRPMGRVLKPLREMGAILREVKNQKGRFITVSGGSLKGGVFKLPIASAQLKSAILLAGLTASQPVIVSEPVKSRDHSERMLKAFGADIRVKGRTIILKPARLLTGQKIIVPSDFSSAAFFIVAGLISRDATTRLVLKNVGINPTRIGALEILKKMGGKIRVATRKNVCGEPVADLVVYPSNLHGTPISGQVIPRLIDEIPILCIAAAMAKGKTVIRGAEELRIKETDRIRALATELSRFGIAVKELPDGLEMAGFSQPIGATGKSYGDHRMAMSLAILGTVAKGKTILEDVDCIATSFPSFIPLLQKVGGRVQSSRQKTL